MTEELKFHPLADIFPLMEGAEFDALVADIKANGLREKIDLYQGLIVDGRNRYLALQQLGIDPSADPGKYFRKAIYVHTVGGEVAPHEQSNDDRVRGYIISKNIHRRHLTAEQKRDLIAKLLKTQPEKSNVTIAKVIKADDKTVAKVRRELEATSEIPRLEKTIGADGKARKQPTKKATMPAVIVPYRSVVSESKPIAVAFKVAKAREEPVTVAVKVVDEHSRNEDLGEKLRAAEIKIAGLESENEELKAENARLRAELEAKQETTTTEKQAEAVMPKRGRGRPKGSGNKPRDIGSEHINDFRALGHAGPA